VFHQRGDSGYVARYRFDKDEVTILAVRHQKEVGY
jgi:plasmid stabilization system protein ParE